MQSTLIDSAVSCTLFTVISAQDEKEIYQGKSLGKFNSYHHQVRSKVHYNSNQLIEFHTIWTISVHVQVAGEVYAVDESTFLIKNFIYDGNGPDTFFWAGSSNRAGPQGFIVPDENGRTNVLRSYLNKEFTLKLFDGKKISDIKWLAIYDLTIQVFQVWYKYQCAELMIGCFIDRKTLVIFQSPKSLNLHHPRSSTSCRKDPTKFPLPWLSFSIQRLSLSQNVIMTA